MLEGDEDSTKILSEILFRLDKLESRISALEKVSTFNNAQKSTTVELNSTLLEYVKNNWGTYSEDKIRQALISSGWKSTDIDLAIEKVKENNVINSQENQTEQKTKQNFEVELGEKWFSRFGIAALVVGIALFLIYTLQYFGPFGKAAIGILSAISLMVLGFWLEKKYEVFGKILFGGGVATLYFTIYAMHYFESTRIIQNQYLDIILLALISISYFFYMLRYKTENLALYPLILVFLTVNLGNLDRFSLIMIVIFMVAILGVFIKSAWKTGFVSAMFMAYATLARWLAPSLSVFQGFQSGAYLFSVSITTIFYIFFTLSHSLIFEKLENKEQEDFVLTAFNSIFFSIFFLTISWNNILDPSGIMLLVFAVLNFLLSVVSKLVSKKNYRSRTYLALGTIFLLFFVPMAFDAEVVTYCWLLLGLIYMGYGIFKGTVRSRAIGLSIMSLSLVSLFGISSDDGKNTIFYISLLLFGVIFEVISVILSKHDLNSNMNDKPENDVAIRATLSGLSVGVLAMFAFYAFDTKYLSLSWGIIGSTVSLLGFIFNDKFFRRSGLGLLVIVILKLFFVDLAGMETIYRILSFIVLGILLLTISFGYNKYKDQIKRYL